MLLEGGKRNSGDSLNASNEMEQMLFVCMW